MIVLNNFPTNNDALGDKNIKNIKIPSDKREELTISPPKLGFDSHNVAVDKSIEFLQKQHEAMLKGLHKEIESLKRINRDLQYRLVMCTCPAGYSGDKLPQNKTNEENTLRQEILILQEDLENEKKKNACLLKQLERLKVSQNPVRGLPRFTCKNGRLSISSEQKNVSEIDEMFQSSNISQTQHDNHEVSRRCQDVLNKNTDFIADTATVNNDLITPTTGTLSVNKLIPTVSHSVPVKSSTTLDISENNLLTKRTILHSSDSEHVFEKQDKEIIKSNDELISTHVLPIRLPALNSRKPLIQASLSSEQYKTNANTIIKHSPTHNSLRNEKTLNTELNSIKITRPIKSAIGRSDNNTTKPLKPSIHNPQTKQTDLKTTHHQQLHDLNLKKVTQAYSIGLKPFLPSITKSTDLINHQNDRHQKKSTKTSQRKRTQQNIYPF
ncbi:unnamed protein product [Schistosoma turkestanicum]|nr:unnamed protein product [Schistosoma turkestanicum]